MTGIDRCFPKLTPKKPCYERKIEISVPKTKVHCLKIYKTFISS